MNFSLGEQEKWNQTLTFVIDIDYFYEDLLI